MINNEPSYISFGPRTEGSMRLCEMKKEKNLIKHEVCADPVWLGGCAGPAHYVKSVLEQSF